MGLFRTIALFYLGSFDSIVRRCMMQREHCEKEAKTDWLNAKNLIHMLAARERSQPDENPTPSLLHLLYQTWDLCVHRSWKCVFDNCWQPAWYYANCLFLSDFCRRKRNEPEVVHTMLHFLPLPPFPFVSFFVYTIFLWTGNFPDLMQ